MVLEVEKVAVAMVSVMRAEAMVVEAMAAGAMVAVVKAVEVMVVVVRVVEKVVVVKAEATGEAAMVGADRGEVVREVETVEAV